MSGRSYTNAEKTQRAKLILEGTLRAARHRSTARVDWQIERIDERAEQRYQDEMEARYKARRDLDKAEAEAKAAPIRAKAASIRADTSDRIKSGKAKKGWF